jgi:hypothetical protein
VAEPGHLFIVARANTDLYAFLTQALSGARGISVVLDRRHGERRRAPRPPRDPRARPERRRAQIDADLRTWQLAMAAHRPG